MRDDRARRCGAIQARGQQGDVFLQSRTESVTLGRLHDPERYTAGGRYGRRGGRGKNKTARAVDQEVDEHPRSGDVTTGDAECLAERSHLDLDAIRQAKLSGQPLRTASADTDGVSLIEQEDRAVTLLELHEFTQRRQVAIHAEDRFGDDQNPALGMGLPRPFQMRFEFGKVVVGKNPHLGAARVDPVDQTGMSKLIKDHDIPAAHQCRDRPGRRRDSGGEDQGCLRPFGRREFFFERGMFRRRAADQAGGGRSRARSLRGLGHGFRKRGM